MTLRAAFSDTGEVRVKSSSQSEEGILFKGYASVG
jgi:hypothetical protein